MTSKPALWKILKGIPQTEEKDKHNLEERGKNESHRKVEKQLRIRKEPNTIKKKNNKIIENDAYFSVMISVFQ
jgi:hypothetical protein